MNKDWGNMSNADIKLELFKLKNDYESKKNTIGSILNEMDKMDLEYNEGLAELQKRNITI